MLPLLHHCLLGYSKSLAAAIFSKGYELQGKTDHRFVELAFKVLREVFGYRPSLTPTQFLQGGYAGEGPRRRGRVAMSFLCIVANATDAS